MTSPGPVLPVDQIIPQLVQDLQQHGSVVLRAATGAGKTTRVPPAVAAAAPDSGQKLILLEPRRVAARAAATRMAQEKSESTGASVGYRVRFEECCSGHTRILAVTEGILLRQIQADPYLESIHTVIIDEFHERRLDTDLCLAMLQRIRQTVRPDLRLVVMSATMDPQPVSEYLNRCPIIDCPGRSFPVDIHWSRRNERQSIPDLAAQGVRDVFRSAEGDVLVFLPGKGEINRTDRLLQPLAQKHSLLIQHLHGSMPLDEQNKVLAESKQQRIILATNVAETSVTVSGVTAVVDTGTVRQMGFDPETGLNRLQLQQISKASADQRSGRAGRTAPGRCLRLWEEHQHRLRRDEEPAEISRSDLSGVILALLAWGENDLSEFPWFQPPPEESVQHALELLQLLRTIDADSRVTDLGHWAVQFPLPPRLACVVIDGFRSGHGMRACLLAALLSEQEPFLQGRDHRSPRDQLILDSDSDVLDRLHAIETFLNEGKQETPFGEIHRNQLQSILRITKQLADALHHVASRIPPTEQISDADAALKKALLAGFPDRVALRKTARAPQGMMAGGRRVRLAQKSAVRAASLFICINVDGSGSEAEVRQASAVELNWLPQDLISESEDLFFHPSQKQVVARRRTTFLDLILNETPAPVTNHAAAAEVLFSAASSSLKSLLPDEKSSAHGFLQRVRCLGEWMPDLLLPDFGNETLLQCLKTLCGQCRSFDDLRKADWMSVFEMQLTHAQQSALRQFAPERLQVPSGSQIPLIYQDNGPPILAVRIQEVFGLRNSPVVGRGTIPVLMHLLGPNHRPQQVTSDLESFWKNTYPTIRGQLARRYPRHPWPEDPLTAPPVRK